MDEAQQQEMIEVEQAASRLRGWDLIQPRFDLLPEVRGFGGFAGVGSLGGLGFGIWGFGGLGVWGLRLGGWG